MPVIFADGAVNSAPRRASPSTPRLLPGRLEGIGWFAHETLSRIVTAHPEHQFIFLFDRPWNAQFIYAPNVVPVAAGPPTGTGSSTASGSMPWCPGS